MLLSSDDGGVLVRLIAGEVAGHLGPGPPPRQSTSPTPLSPRRAQMVPRESRKRVDANCHEGPAPGVCQTALMASSSHLAVNLADKLAQFDSYWSPRTVGVFNGHDVMVVKVKGEFLWHHHDNTDDFFLVLSGRLTIRIRDGDVVLGPGEMFIVPVGVEHQPFADEETELMLIEPTGTPNTGESANAPARIQI